MTQRHYVTFTLDGETITEHYRHKASEIGFDKAVQSLIETSSISEGDAKAIIRGEKRLITDKDNNIIVSK